MYCDDYNGFFIVLITQNVSVILLAYNYFVVCCFVLHNNNNNNNTSSGTSLLQASELQSSCYYSQKLRHTWID